MDRRASEENPFEAEGPLELTIPSSSKYVLLARLIVAHVGQIAGFGPEEVYDLKLAITEAATNVIRHAAVDSFDIGYLVTPGEVRITVTDAGGGFDVEGCEPPSEERGGFGLPVIRNLVDEMTIDSTKSGTRLTMIRKVGASVEASSG